MTSAITKLAIFIRKIAGSLTNSLCLNTVTGKYPVAYGTTCINMYHIHNTLYNTPDLYIK